MEKKVINYGYEGFDDFNLIVEDGILTWTGQKSYFKGITFKTIPTISKINDHIFFVSWITGANGGDNVVYNLKTMKVNSHLNPSDFEPRVMMMVRGNIYKFNSEDAKRPNKIVTPLEDIKKILEKNMKEKNLPELFDVEKNKTVRFLEDKIARQELENKVISYKAEGKTITIKVRNDETFVSEGDFEEKSFQTYATKIEDGVYFISWENNYGGNHIIVNTTINKVFTHLSSVGERREKIHNLDEFKTITK